MHSCIHSFTHSLIHSFLAFFIHPSIHSFVRSFIRSSIVRGDFTTYDCSVKTSRTSRVNVSRSDFTSKLPSCIRDPTLPWLSPARISDRLKLGLFSFPQTYRSLPPNEGRHNLGVPQGPQIRARSETPQDCVRDPK